LPTVREVWDGTRLVERVPLLDLSWVPEGWWRLLTDQRTRTVFRDLSGAVLPQGDWPQQRILRGETLSGASAVEKQAYTIAGEAQWWTISGAPLRAEDGTITGAVLVNTDITRRKELEDALRASERRLRAAPSLTLRARRS